MQHQSILGYRSGRYLKLALLACVGAIAGYAWHEPPTVYLKPYGGTACGYTMGTIAGVLVLWLMLLGVRKRGYRGAIGTLQGWTSLDLPDEINAVVVRRRDGAALGRAADGDGARGGESRDHRAPGERLPPRKR